MTPNLLKAFLADRAGATAIEYGLLAALISLGLITGLGALSDTLQGTLGTITEEVEKAR